MGSKSFWEGQGFSKERILQLRQAQRLAPGHTAPRCQNPNRANLSARVLFPIKVSRTFPQIPLTAEEGEPRLFSGAWCSGLRGAEHLHTFVFHRKILYKLIHIMFHNMLFLYQKKNVFCLQKSLRTTDDPGKLLCVSAAFHILPGGAWGAGGSPRGRGQRSSVICKHRLSRGLESFQGSQSPELFHFSSPGRCDSQDSLRP